MVLPMSAMDAFFQKIDIPDGKSPFLASSLK